MLSALPNIDGSDLHRFADKVGRWGNDQGFRVVSELLPATVARAVGKAAQSGEGAGLSALLRRRGLDRWVEVWEKITHLFAQADAINLDRKQVVLNAFFALEEAAR